MNKMITNKFLTRSSKTPKNFMKASMTKLLSNQISKKIEKILQKNLNKYIIQNNKATTESNE